MMSVGPYSKDKIYKTFAEWEVPRDYADPMYNYLVYGFSPGGFFTSVLANDWHYAVMRSHPSNTIEALKAVTGWIYDRVPHRARGSYEAVKEWCGLTSEERAAILLDYDLILSDKEETIMALKGVPTPETVLF